MAELLCEVPGHAEPARVHDGLRVCWRDAERISTNAIEAVRLHTELLDQQAWRTAGDAPRVTGTRERSLVISPRKAEARAEVEVMLASWAKLVVDERGWGPPAHATVQWSASIIVGSHTWLAAHELAVQCCTELGELAHGWVRGIARPSGSVKTPAGTCPLCRGKAVGTIRPADDVRESMIVCQANNDHRWAPHEWSRVLGRDLNSGAMVDAGAAAALLRIDPESLRQLVRRGQIERFPSGFEIGDLQRLYGNLWGAM